MSMILLFICFTKTSFLDSRNNVERPKIVPKMQYKVNLEQAQSEFMDYDKMDENLDVDGRVATYLPFENKNINGKRTKYSFWKSFIDAKSTTFSNCFAFGAGLTFGGGGALYAQQSSVRTTSCTFQSNSASHGGSICVVNCMLIAESKTTFSYETAYKSGGSIYAIYSDEISEIDNEGDTDFMKTNQLSIVNTKFSDCQSKETHGAVFIYKSEDAYFENVLFLRNQARQAGGALSLSDSQAVLIECTFQQNKCCVTPSGSNVISTFQQKFINRDLIIPRAGGAIIFCSHLSEASKLYTQHCCFYRNLNNQPVDESNPSNDILLTGKVWYRSFQDHFGYSKEKAIGTFGEVDDITTLSSETTFEVVIQCVKSVESPIYDYNDESLSSATIVSTSFETTSYDVFTDITNIKTPTIVFPETPTYAGIGVQTPTMYTHKELIPFATPCLTPDISTVTPETTPFTTPYETPYTTPFTTPDETPEKTPFTTPDTSVLTPELTPFTTPYETPEKTPFTTPYETPYETPFTTPINTPTPAPTLEEHADTTTTEKQRSNAWIYGLVAGLILLLIIILIIIIIIMKRKKEDTSADSSSVELASEDVINATTNSQIIEEKINNDNPLWITSVMGESDDPFNVDFEEEAMFMFKNNNNTESFFL